MLSLIVLLCDRTSKITIPAEKMHAYFVNIRVSNIVVFPQKGPVVVFVDKLIHDFGSGCTPRSIILGQFVFRKPRAERASMRVVIQVPVVDYRATLLVRQVGERWNN